jgi:hypothetical protein
MELRHNYQKSTENGQHVSRISQRALASVRHMPASANKISTKGLKKFTCKYLNCGMEFHSKYRRDYCPGNDDACYKAEKSLRQSIVDRLVAEIKKGLYANLKIFREKLPEAGQTKMDYDEALKKGFDEDAFYGTYKHKNTQWHTVEQYYFLIEHSADKRFLHIYKP